MLPSAGPSAVKQRRLYISIDQTIYGAREREPVYLGMLSLFPRSAGNGFMRDFVKNAGGIETVGDIETPNACRRSRGPINSLIYRYRDVSIPIDQTIYEPP